MDKNYIELWFDCYQEKYDMEKRKSVITDCIVSFVFALPTSWGLWVFINCNLSHTCSLALIKYKFFNWTQTVITFCFYALDICSLLTECLPQDKVLGPDVFPLKLGVKFLRHHWFRWAKNNFPKIGDQGPAPWTAPESTLSKIIIASYLWRVVRELVVKCRLFIRVGS